MKNIFLLFITVLLIQAKLISQEALIKESWEPITFDVKSHDPNFKNIPGKSFYESKNDWQYIIDTTWGMGMPYEDKLDLFNYYADILHDNFDGFQSLNHTPATWDTLRDFYYNKLDTNTSHGRFAAIMYHFARQLSDLHTWANDINVYETPLNPGIPILVTGGFRSIEHFGAVLSALEDSTIFVLRSMQNHPLGLEPGDIILGYNGELWIDLLLELFDAELPAYRNVFNSQSARTHNLLICAGMNWHLFDTIDIVKYNTGDTLHLSVLPLLNINIPPELNNEQVEISNIPFPDYFNDQAVSYGIFSNTNIGYIYVFSEAIPTFAGANQQFNSAVLALKDVDALIIDMRWNEGGYAFWQDAFGFWTNEIVHTLEWAFRCNPNDFTLCFDGDTVLCSLQGQPPGKYQRPIAVLLGPFCGSMGDINAYRLRDLENVKTFGKSSMTGMGWNVLIEGYQGYNLRYSRADIAHISNRSYFLNGKEYPIDYPVWHTIDDVVQGNDAVVEAALDWINNLVYGHDVVTDNNYASPGVDTINISAIIENPNSHNVVAKVFVKDLNNTLVDSLELAETESGSIWQGNWLAANYEDLFKLDIKTTDQNIGEYFTLENVNRITTAGPVKIDTLSITKLPNSYRIKPFVRNYSQSISIENLTIDMSTYDSTITQITGSIIIANIAPGEVVEPTGNFYVTVDTNFSGTFNFNFEIISNEWLLWKDSVSIITSVEERYTLPISYQLFQNYPNPFNPVTTVKYGLPERSFVELKI